MLFLNDGHTSHSFPPMLVYGAFIDYDEIPWEKAGALSRFEECVIKFCDFVRTNNKKLLVILTPQNLPPEKQSPLCRADRIRMTCCNDVWRKAADQYAEVSLLEVGNIASEDEIINNLHYRVPLLKKLGDHIRRWFDQEGGSPAGPLRGA